MSSESDSRPIGVTIIYRRYTVPNNVMMPILKGLLIDTLTRMLEGLAIQCRGYDGNSMHIPSRWNVIVVAEAACASHAPSHSPLTGIKECLISVLNIRIQK